MQMYVNLLDIRTDTMKVFFKQNSIRFNNLGWPNWNYTITTNTMHSRQFCLACLSACVRAWVYLFNLIRSRSGSRTSFTYCYCFGLFQCSNYNPILMPKIIFVWFLIISFAMRFQLTFSLCHRSPFPPYDLRVVFNIYVYYFYLYLIHHSKSYNCPSYKLHCQWICILISSNSKKLQRFSLWI